MDTIAVSGIGQVGSVSATPLAQTVVVVALVALGVLLLAVRWARAGAARRRKAAGSVYFDRDAAHYGPTGRTSASPGVEAPGHIGPTPGPRHNAAQPTAPSFTAARPTRRQRHEAPAQAPPVPTAPVARAAHSEVAPPTPPAPPERPEADRPLPGGPPSMAEPPVAEPGTPPALAPLPGLRPKGTLPADLPAMPAPPPRRPDDGPDSSA